MKHITIIVPASHANLSSIVGSYKILTRANQFWQKLGNKSRIRISIAGFVKELTLHNGFFSIHPTDIKQIRKTDLIIIPSVSHHYEEAVKNNNELISWIKAQHLKGAEIASICTGAFLLASTGLLAGRSCATHWNAAADFRRNFPDVDLHVDKLITAENGIYTNGGAYSFLNLILLLVEKYFDRETAIFCSKVFQIDIERVSQSPFTVFKAQKEHGDDLISQAQRYIETHLNEKISFEKLASDLAISRRNFDRRFIKATGNTPVEYLQRVKVEVSKRTLEQSRKTIFEVMNEVGYSDDKAFREVFKKITGLSPLDYRSRYNKHAVPATFELQDIE